MISRRVWKATAVVILTAGALVRFSAGEADAVPLAGSTPANGATVDAPTQIELRFAGQVRTVGIAIRADDGTDIAAVRMGYVSVTPLRLDQTHYRAIVEMERWRFES